MGLLIDQQIPWTTGAASPSTIPIGLFTPKTATEILFNIANATNPLAGGTNLPGSSGQSSYVYPIPVTGFNAQITGNGGTGIGFAFSATTTAPPTFPNHASASGSSPLDLSMTVTNVGSIIFAQAVIASTPIVALNPVTSTGGNTLNLIYSSFDAAASRGLAIWAGVATNAVTNDTWHFSGTGGTFGGFFYVGEVTGLIGVPTIVNAQELYEYENITLNERTLVATGTDASGAASVSNIVGYWNASGALTTIFTPSAGADKVRAVDSRDWMYFADGVQADLQKWNIVNGAAHSNTGIVAPATPVVVGSATGGGSLTFPLTSVANHIGANTTYTGTGLSGLQSGTSVQIGGFTNSGNNGTFTVVSSTPTTVTVNNGAGVAETATATLTTQNLLRPSTLLNGWGGNAHVGSYEGGVDQGFSFGLDPSSTGAYTNPGNAFDGDPTTFASFSGQHTHVYGGCVWSFAGISNSATNVTLNILSEVPTSGIDGQVVTLRSAGIWYSIDGGTTWTQVYDTSTFTKKYSQIAIPNGTTLSNVQVMAFTDAHDDMYHKVYDIYMQATFTGSGPITLQSGRVYFEAFENSVTGHISAPSPVSASTGAVFGGSIPLQLVSSSPDPQVDTEIILATADGGDQTTLFFVASLPIGTTTYLDNTPEEVLLQANTYADVDANGVDHGIYDSDPPPNGKYPTKHQGRIWLIQDNVLFFSKSTGDLTTATGLIAGKYEEAWNPSDQFDISEGAETGVGLYSDGVTLYIATKRHIRRLLGDNPLNFQLPQIIFNDVGLNNQEVWRSIYIEGTPAGSMWMTPDFRVIRSDFNTYQNVGEQIQSTLNTINASAANNCWASYVGQADQNFYVLAIPTGINTIPDTLCVYNIARGTWFIWKSPVGYQSGLYYMNFAGIPRFVFCSTLGTINLFDSTQILDFLSTTLSEPVTTVAQTTWLDLSDPQLRKVLNEVEVGTGDPTMLITVEGATTEAQFETPNVVATNIPLISNFLGDLKTYLAGYTTKDRFYRFTFTSGVTGANVREVMDYFSIEAIPFHRI